MPLAPSVGLRDAGHSPARNASVEACVSPFGLSVRAPATSGRCAFGGFTLEALS